MKQTKEERLISHSKSNKKWRERNKEKVKEISRRWREKNPEKLKTNHTKWRNRNKKKCITNTKRWQKENPKRTVYLRRKWQMVNREKVNRINREWRKKNWRKVKVYYQLPTIKFSMRLRMRVAGALKGYTREGKIKSSDGYGINYKKIIEHLKPFPEDCSKYHIDHIRPLCSFNFINKDGTQNLKEIKKAFAPENHQWLLAEENLSKSGKWGIKEQVRYLFI